MEGPLRTELKACTFRGWGRGEGRGEGETLLGFVSCLVNEIIFRIKFENLHYRTVGGAFPFTTVFFFFFF